jgi:hypothetical protein
MWDVCTSLASKWAGPLNLTPLIITYSYVYLLNRTSYCGTCVPSHSRCRCHRNCRCHRCLSEAHLQVRTLYWRKQIPVAAQHGVTVIKCLVGVRQVGKVQIRTIKRTLPAIMSLYILPSLHFTSCHHHPSHPAIITLHILPSLHFTSCHHHTSHPAIITLHILPSSLFTSCHHLWV